MPGSAVKVREEQSAGTWLEAQQNRVVLVLLAGSLAVRLFFAARTFLNADECLHYHFSHQPDWTSVWLETQTTMHPYPPLLVLLLHALQTFGNSEILLRAPTLLAGTAMLWFAYRWLSLAFDRGTAFLAVCLLAFAPGNVSVGFEVRSYALMMCGLAAYFYYLERAVRENSSRCMGIGLAWWMVAIWSHYSALWICIASGVWMLWRHRQGRVPRRPFAVWLAGQAAGVATYLYFWVAHISRLRASGNENAAIYGFLRESYFRPGEDMVLVFPLRQTWAFFDYLLGNAALGALGAVGLAVAIGILAWRGWKKADVEARSQALLLFLPFAAGLTGALARVHPYGGSRHAAYLFLFGAAALAWLVRTAFESRRLWQPAAGLAIAALLLLSIVRGNPNLPGSDRAIRHVEEATNYLRARMQPGHAIFADHESLITLAYYLGRNDYLPYHSRPSGNLLLGGYPVFTNAMFWSLEPQTYRGQMRDMMLALNVPATAIWCFEATLAENIVDALTRSGQQGQLADTARFGSQVAVFRFAD